MIIGIPRAGLYYIYGEFWRVFFETLGFEVLISKLTDKSILEQGLKAANSEMCLPMKVMYGHILELQDKVDHIFLPQMDECKWGEGTFGTSTFFCPYFVGLADLMKAEFPEMEILRGKMSFTDNKIDAEPWFDLTKKLKKTRAEAGTALLEASRAHLDNISKFSDNKKTGKKKIALIGRPYIIYDEQANLGLIGRIKERGYDVETIESLDLKDIDKSLEEVPELHRSHWYLTNQEYGAIHYLAKQENIAGIVYIVPFSCGQDFAIEDFVIKKVRKKKPVTTIAIDEATGEAGLNTRLDAFIDMLK